MGLFFLSLFVFALFGRPFDFFLNSLHIPLVLSIATLLLVAMSSGSLGRLSHPVSTLQIGLVAWLLVGIPFSVWPGGSYELVINQSLKSVMTYFLVVAAAAASRDAVKILRSMCYGLALAGVFTFVFGAFDEDGRLALEAGQYANPNDLALALVSGLFLWWMIARNPGENLFIRFLGFATVAPFLFVIQRTGSRTALVSIVLTICYVFLRQSWSGRIKLAAGVALVGGGMLIFSGDSVLMQRLEDSFEDKRTSKEARNSMDSRLQLLKDSVVLTFQNPLLGVGPGMFTVAQNEHAIDQGMLKGSWHVTHNTYTQLSSEAGIPALAMFIAILYICFRDLRRVARLNAATPTTRRAEVQVLCTGLETMWVAYLTGFCFGSFAYSPIIPTLVGITVAFTRCASRELAQARGRLAQQQSA